MLLRVVGVVEVDNGPSFEAGSGDIGILVCAGKAEGRKTEGSHFGGEANLGDDSAIAAGGSKNSLLRSSGKDRLVVR